MLASGAWMGELLADTLGEEDWRSRFQPRRGHLLELEKPKGMLPISHGLMEVGYTTVSSRSERQQGRSSLPCENPT